MRKLMLPQHVQLINEKQRESAARRRQRDTETDVAPPPRKQKTKTQKFFDSIQVIFKNPFFRIFILTISSFRRGEWAWTKEEVFLKSINRRLVL